MTVGTTPTLTIMQNPQRIGWRVTFIATNIIAANTGKLFLGRNFAPSAVTGAPNQGSVITQSGEISESKKFDNDTIFRGDIWLVSDTAAQQIDVEEVTADTPLVAA